VVCTFSSSSFIIYTISFLSVQTVLTMSWAIDATFQMHPDQAGDLNRYGSPSLAPHCLSNPVHALWSFQNFTREIRREVLVKELTSMPDPPAWPTRDLGRKLPAQTYDRLLPAFRLASLFLLKSLPFFWNISFAPYRGTGKQVELVLDGVWNKQRDAQICLRLDEMAKKYYLLHSMYGWEMGATGMTSYTYGTLDPNLPNAKSALPNSQKSKYIWTFISKESMDLVGSPDWPNLPLAIQQRVLFQFASLLMHELAHFAIMFRGDQQLIEHEPYYCRSEPYREMGFSWEQYMFGGVINMIEGEFEGLRPSKGLTGLKLHAQWLPDHLSYTQSYEQWHHPKSKIDDLNHSPAQWLIASKSIEEFFDMRAWYLTLQTEAAKGHVTTAPFEIHLSPALFGIRLQEETFTYYVWYFKRLRKAFGIVWADVLGYQSEHSDYELADCDCDESLSSIGAYSDAYDSDSLDSLEPLSTRRFDPDSGSSEDETMASGDPESTSEGDPMDTREDYHPPQTRSLRRSPRRRT
jgi:hypothetical protein